ncbi:MAG: FUSC family protein [Acidobacteriaceae bacterium]|nr:FUSC family protein [Acidobacteriaceae bacterium]
MAYLNEISADTLVTPWAQRTTHEGLVAMLAIGLCLLLGVLTGHNAAGAIAAGGAFTAGFAVFHPALGSRILSMMVATLTICSAAFLGSLSAEWTPAVLVVVALAGLNYGLLSAFGASAGWIGQQAAVYLVVATYFPNGPRLAAGRATMVLTGGILQIGIHLLFRLRDTTQYSTPLWKATLARTQAYVRSLPEHMAWGSSTLSYSSRQLVTIVVATALYRELHLRNGYWIPMTALLCLKQQWTGTISRSLARVVGTISGVTISFVLAHTWHHWPLPLLGVMVMLAAMTSYSLQAVNYAIFSMAITLYIVFLFRFGGFSEYTAAHLRLMNTVIGGALALTIDGLWLATARIYDRLTAKPPATGGPA